ncbi:UDP-N-acetylmuramoyl-tripeptide--D-alanyl-D-alanine ligase [Paenibacillus sp. NEAU-GSW1]|uniref:UDP-N-acetylmuramoyl-tripeptide--D-alanyl-D- alanine ligase n=1 Tax=Paenibacillus sp. NEAU-GSW1 TaxID=2682486 RepID=UPI0012E2F13D|nr:UDP-N-acetylmuramoyl-tripeptide--D-alanyl-D-alanine ligase [Paenibacillus sp. NEAU-GSW1]MUT66194.1 UDP-N-acetylmuramoyl-tripeptide--D-alanyl-D-alanine ligase [Paenibacillus sp. NEAU-GSW1]
MIKRNLEQVAAMCGAKYNNRDAAVRIEGVSTDSRRVQAGQLFVPLVGEQFDGHHYVEQALKDGAAAAMWQKGIEVPESLAEAPLLLVKDPLKALQQLASSYREELYVRVIGITGSNGKTTTKDMVAAALGTSYRVHKTAGNLNNHIGLPLTVLQLDEETDCAVLEMGMSGFGEIELLTNIARPDIAVITNIGDAHLLQLGSREGIAKAKLEIAQGLQPRGILLYNGDEPLLAAELANMALPEGVQLQTFGLHSDNDWSASHIEVGAVSSSFNVVRKGETISDAAEPFTIPVPGQHNVSNALAAIAIGRRLGISSEQLREGLSGLELTGMRIQPVQAYNGAMLLNDAYNANPTAVRAAIDLVAQLSGFRKKWIVLGDMLELGPDEEALHFETGAYMTPAKADAVLTLGSLTAKTAEGAKTHFPADAVIHFDDKEKLSAWLKEQIQADDLVLVKGSRGMRMEQIVQTLEAR